jgi:hypothetical protein
MCRRVVFVCVVVAVNVFAQPVPPPDLLPRFQASVKETLRRLPDYTCIETIARSRRAPTSHHYQPLDTIRLQVGLIGGRERHSWPDATRFDDRELRDLIGRGIVGTGDFAGHVQHIFLSPATTFTPHDDIAVRDRPAARFEYEVPVEYSRYKLRVPPHEFEVGVHGSFEVDIQTLDLLTLEVHADEIPLELGMSRVSEVISYTRIPIGDSEFLLATSSQLTMVALDGEEYRNQITFAECRQFRAESNIRFDGDQTLSPSAVSTRPVARASLPPSLSVEITLESEIRPETAAIGDAIHGVVAHPVRDGGKAIVPQGAVVHGRLVRLERSAQPFDHYVVGLEFHTVETTDASFDLFATMQDAGPAPGILPQAKRLDPVFTRKRTARLDILVREKPRGEGILHWDAKHIPIRRGLKMRWLTVDPGSLANRGP